MVIKITVRDYIAVCGLTKEITRNLSYASDNPKYPFNLPCNAHTPCYCYGEVCLRGQSCSSGNVYVQGRPVLNKLWMANEETANKNSLIVCQQLGFHSVTETRVGSGTRDTR